MNSIMNLRISFVLVTFTLVGIYQVKAGLDPTLRDECLKSPISNTNAMLELPEIDIPLLSGGLTAGLTGLQDPFIDLLKSKTAMAQLPIINAIKTIHPNADVQGFWGANRIALNNAPCVTLAAISLIPGVTTVRKPVTTKLQFVGTPTLASASAAVIANDPQWGVAKINAPAVWSDASTPTKGSGIVVANIDSGVRSSHEVLKDNWRGGDFSWFDGFANTSTGPPDDPNGHGTHVMGTICGKNGIGVAPEATWIACRGCSGDGSCAEAPLLTCGQWILCPYTITNDTKTEDCTKRPRIVNNSWGGAIGGSFYNQVIENWKKVGIIPIFAAGNFGPTCLTVGAPANQAIVISSVGATNEDDSIAKFSSKGPSPYTFKFKPEVSAPGAKIYSTWNTTDTAYATLDGTSMASPHVAGAVALLLAKNSTLTYEQVMQVLETTAVQPSSGKTCDLCSCVVFNFFCCIESYIKPFPNNSFGYGRIDIAAAYKAV